MLQIESRSRVDHHVIEVWRATSSSLSMASSETCVGANSLGAASTNNPEPCLHQQGGKKTRIEPAGILKRADNRVVQP
jgi:hypothetical protein